MNNLQKIIFFFLLTLSFNAFGIDANHDVTAAYDQAAGNFNSAFLKTTIIGLLMGCVYIYAQISGISLSMSAFKSGDVLTIIIGAFMLAGIVSIFIVLFTSLFNI